MEESNEVLIAYFRAGKESSGEIKVYRVISIPNMFLNTYEKLMYEGLKFEGYSASDFKNITGTFKVKDTLNIHNIVKLNSGTFPTIKVYMDGKPYINKSPVLTYQNKDFKTVVRNKEQLIGFYSVINKHIDIRLFYDSMSKDFIIVDSKIEEIDSIYNDIDKYKNNNTIGFHIQDIHKQKYAVTWNDLFKFCKKELRKQLKPRGYRYTLDQKIIRILTADFNEDLENIYLGLWY